MKVRICQEENGVLMKFLSFSDKCRDDAALPVSISGKRKIPGRTETERPEIVSFNEFQNVNG